MFKTYGLEKQYRLNFRLLVEFEVVFEFRTVRNERGISEGGSPMKRAVKSETTPLRSGSPRVWMMSQSPMRTHGPE